MLNLTADVLEDLRNEKIAPITALTYFNGIGKQVDIIKTVIKANKIRNELSEPEKLLLS